MVGLGVHLQRPLGEMCVTKTHLTNTQAHTHAVLRCQPHHGAALMVVHTYKDKVMNWTILKRHLNVYAIHFYFWCIQWILKLQTPLQMFAR